jgi:hypothetical protein
MLACNNINPALIQRFDGMQVTYCREGALSQDLAKLEILRPLLARLGGLHGRLGA